MSRRSLALFRFFFLVHPSAHATLFTCSTTQLAALVLGA